MKRTRILFFFIATAISFSLTSCLNDDNDPQEIRPGFISFINAMPDTAALDFYVGDKLEDSPIAFRERYPTSSYVQAAPYTYLVEIAYPDGQQPIYRANVPVKEDAYASVYIYNNNEEVKGMLVDDELESPASGKAKIRFLNLGTDAPDVDLVPEGETTAWFSALEFEKASEDYEEVDAGTYVLDVLDSGTDEVLTSRAVELEDSKVYTLWLSGIYEETGQKALSLESIEHEEVEVTTPAP